MPLACYVYAAMMGRSITPNARAERRYFMSYGFPARIISSVGCALALTLALAGSARADSFTTYGDVARYAIPAGAVLLSTLKDDTEGLGQLLVSGGVTLGLTYGLKHAVNARRPDGGTHSFPSGHAAFAFTGAAYIHERYGWQWGLPATLAAGAVAWSRVDARRHYWRDVLASAAIAHASAFFLVDHKDDRVTLFPMIGGRKPSFGLVGRIRF